MPFYHLELDIHVDVIVERPTEKEAILDLTKPLADKVVEMAASGSKGIVLVTGTTHQTERRGEGDSAPAEQQN